MHTPLVGDLTDVTSACKQDKFW